MRNARIVSIALGYLLQAISLKAQSTNPPPPEVSGDALLAKAGIKPIGNWAVDPTETAELNQLYSQALSAANSIPFGPDADAQRHEVDNSLRAELESFLVEHPKSAYAPALHESLARSAQMRCGYSLALEHFHAAVDMLAGSPDETAQLIRLDSAGGLARLLAFTGQLAEYDALQASMAQQGFSTTRGADWRLAHELRGWVQQHPSESYKCGLYCLDQLGRLTQPGQFLPRNITENLSSTNGFTGADLLGFAAKAGLRVHAALFTDTNNIPVPCILHLRSEHFVLVREQRRAFYGVFDPAEVGVKWLTAPDIIAEATGCVLVSDVAPPTNSASLVVIDSAAAATYRGRCHGPSEDDHNDGGPCTQCPCPPGQGGDPNSNGSSGSAPGSSSGSGGSSGSAPQGPARGGSIVPNASTCATCGGGMPIVTVTEPYLTVWLEDVPLTYKTAYGPPVEVRLAYHDRDIPSLVSSSYWHGAEFGNYQGVEGLWSCSLLSFAELSTDGYTVDLMLPGRGWAAFTFASGATNSSINYQNNVWLEKQGPGAGTSSSAVTNLILHYSNGSQISYGVKDTNYTDFAAVFYMTGQADSMGVSTSFA